MIEYSRFLHPKIEARDRGPHMEELLRARALTTGTRDMRTRPVPLS